MLRVSVVHSFLLQRSSCYVAVPRSAPEAPGLFPVFGYSGESCIHTCILQMRRVKLGLFMWLAEGHTAVRGGTQIWTQPHLSDASAQQVFFFFFNYYYTVISSLAFPGLGSLGNKVYPGVCASASESGSLQRGCESCFALYQLGDLDWTCLCLYFPICKIGQ